MSIEQEAHAEAESRLYDGEDQQISNADESDAFVAGYIAGASRPVTDEQADAAQIAFYECMWGADEPLTARDIGIMREAWKIALEAARALADKETP